MEINSFQILLLIIGSFILGGGVIEISLLLQKYKNIKIKKNNEELIKIKEISVSIIKELLLLYQIKDLEELTNMCIDNIQKKLYEQNIKEYSKEEIKLIIAPILKMMIKQIENAKKHNKSTK